MPHEPLRDGGMDGEAMRKMGAAPFGSRDRHSYCLFCRTGQEPKVMAELAKNENAQALSPQRIKTERKMGRWVPVKKPMMPGYVFLYAQAAEEPGQYAKGLANVLTVLRYGDGTSALRGRDKAFADWLWAQGGMIGVSKAIRIGDRIQIVEGPLKDLGGIIKALDAHKRVAKIELNIVGSTQWLWLSFDYIENGL